MRIEPQIDSGRSEPRINDNNLVLWLNDNRKTASNWYDQSGKNNHGIVYGAGTPPPATPQTLGYLFDGVDDYVDAGGNSFFTKITGEIITISLWGKSNDVTQTGKTLITKPTGATPGANYGIRLLSTTGNIGFYFTNNVTQYIIYSTGIKLSSSWTHIYASFKFGDPTSILVYINGVPISSSWIGDASTIPQSASTPLIIGAFSSIVDFFNGSIDEVRIYNRALSASEIKRLYERTRILFGV